MCIAIMKPKGTILSKDTLHTCWENNPDGAGFMFAEGGQLSVYKGFMNFEDFYTDYHTVEDMKVVLHFRIGTHGHNDEKNTHPFFISDKLAFVHNGIINNIPIPDKSRSDTWAFKEFMKKMYKVDGKFITKDYNQKLISQFIGYSKLIFLDNKGNDTIINPEKGVWDKGVWYSNTSYIPKPKVVYMPTKFNTFGAGELVTLKMDYNAFKKGEVGWVQSESPKGSHIQVVFHKANYDNTTTETTIWVPKNLLSGEELDDAIPY